MGFYDDIEKLKLELNEIDVYSGKVKKQVEKIELRERINDLEVKSEVKRKIVEKIIEIAPIVIDENFDNKIEKECPEELKEIYYFLKALYESLSEMY